MAKKKKKTGLFLLAGLALLGYMLYNQSKRVELGAPTITRFQLQSGGVRLTLALPVFNLSDFTLRLSQFIGFLTYKNGTLGTIMLVQPTDILARAQSVPEFSVVIPYTSIAFELYDLFKEKIPGLPAPQPGQPSLPAPSVNWSDIRIKGTLYADGLRVDINEPVFA